MAQRYRGRLVLMCIGALTPIARLLRQDTEGVLQRSLRAVYIQAQADVTHEGHITPSAAAFNLREDMPAAHVVFGQLQTSVPFVFLGKYAAYKVGIRTQDFEDWDQRVHRRTAEQ